MIIKTSLVIPQMYSLDGARKVKVFDETRQEWREFSRDQDGVLIRLFAGIESLLGRADLEVREISSVKRVNTGTDGYADFDLRMQVEVGCATLPTDYQWEVFSHCGCRNGNHRNARLNGVVALHITNGYDIVPRFVGEVAVEVASKTNEESTIFMIPEDHELSRDNGSLAQLATRVAMRFAARRLEDMLDS